jgi:hypothetical protein
MKTLIERMYHALSNLPCRCERKWDKEQPKGYVIIRQCERCAVMRDYEKENQMIEEQT